MAKKRDFRRGHTPFERLHCALVTLSDPPGEEESQFIQCMWSWLRRRKWASPLGQTFPTSTTKQGKVMRPDFGTNLSVIKKSHRCRLLRIRNLLEGDSRLPNFFFTATVIQKTHKKNYLWVLTSKIGGIRHISKKSYHSCR